MNILITGANGFIGKHLKNHFQREHEIYTISRTTGNDNLSANEYKIDLSDYYLYIYI